MRPIYLLKQKLEPQKDDSKPARCSNCRCKEVYRNGTYKMSRMGEKINRPVAGMKESFRREIRKS